MPIYLFEHKGEIREILLGMNDKKEYTDKDGNVWNRIFVSPNAAIDSVNIDPFSAADFNKKTNAKGTVGDLFDRSKEMSEKRKAKIGGQDPIQEKYYENYSKERNGAVHNDVRKRKLKEKLKKNKWFEAS